MDFRELQYISTVAKYQNITKAAESLYVGQPTLTKAIQRVEQELGLKLFKKVGNKFQLTYAGEVYVRKAEQILLMGEEMSKELSDIVDNEKGVLRVGFPVMRGGYMIPCTIPIFAERYPNVRLEIRESNSSQLEEMLVRGEIDLAFFNRPLKSNKLLTYNTIGQEHLLLVLAQDHPLATQGGTIPGSDVPWIDLSLLKDEPFILFTEAQRTRQITDQLFNEYQFKPKVFLQTRNISAALKLAAQGYGACFSSDTHLRHVDFEKQPLCFRVGRPSITMDFVVASRIGAYIPPYTQEYISIVKQFT